MVAFPPPIEMNFSIINYNITGVSRGLQAFNNRERQEEFFLGFKSQLTLYLISWYLIAIKMC